ncbi:MAG: archease [Anaerolineales bacterium]
MDELPYTEIEHTADWALEVRGGSLADLLVHAAEGMLDLMGAETAPGPSRTLHLHVQAADAEALLVAWLEEILVRMELAPVTFSDFQVRVADSTELEAELREGVRGDLEKMIKAVTFHDLRVEHGPSGWKTVVVFDV